MASKHLLLFGNLLVDGYNVIRCTYCGKARLRPTRIASVDINLIKPMELLIKVAAELAVY